MRAAVRGRKGGCAIKTVLWISRHEMTDDQLSDLERIMEGPVRLFPWRDTVLDVSALLPAVKRADAVAAVLPLELMARLLRLTGGKPLLQAVSRRLPTGKLRTTPEGGSEPEFTFVHDCWQQVLRLEIETKTL